MGRATKRMLFLMTEFSIEASPGQRLRVGWSDENGNSYWFQAKVNGDQITEVGGSTYRNRPTIFQRGATIRRGPGAGMSYHDANAEPWASLVAEASAKVAAGKLATAAFAAKAAHDADRTAETIRGKAQAVRAALLSVKVAAVEALADVPDAALAEVYDRIQNGAI